MRDSGATGLYLKLVVVTRTQAIARCFGSNGAMRQKHFVICSTKHNAIYPSFGTAVALKLLDWRDGSF